MTLGELIKFLSEQDQTKVLPVGFCHPHSYRGYYDCLAFEPAQQVTIASMLACACQADGTTYTGYKGGEYHMTDYTDVYLAEYGCCGVPLHQLLLEAMIDAEELYRLRQERIHLRNALHTAAGWMASTLELNGEFTDPADYYSHPRTLDDALFCQAINEWAKGDSQAWERFRVMIETMRNDAEAEGYRRGVHAAIAEATYEEERLESIKTNPDNKAFVDLYQAMSLGAGKVMRRIRALLTLTDTETGETCNESADNRPFAKVVESEEKLDAFIQTIREA